MSRLISRDPFARQELHRIRVYGVPGCSWCGQVKQTKDFMRSYLFRYDTHTDGGRIIEGDGLFCCVDCWRTYHERLP